MTNHKIRTMLIGLLGVASLAACSTSSTDAMGTSDQTAAATTADEVISSTDTDIADVDTDVDTDDDSAGVTEASADADTDSGSGSGSGSDDSTATSSDGANAVVALAATAGDWSDADEVAITLADGASTSDGDAVSVDGDVVTIGAAGTYRITGTFSDGRIVVDTDDDGMVRIVLDDADITTSTTSALVVDNADSVVLWLAEDSTNHLADTSSSNSTSDTTDGDATEDVPNATVYSADDLVIAGTGALTVDGGGNDAITSKDGLVIVDGSISVTAADDGIRGKDFLVIEGGTITTDVQGDGLTSDDTTTDDAGDTIGVGSVQITGGQLDIVAATDGIDAEADVTIDGGELSIAAGGDGIHAEAALTINGGVIDVTASSEGLEGATITITAGDISVVSSDDGINVADGSGAAGGGGFGGPGGGGQPGASSTSDLYGAISGGTIVVDAGGDGIDVNGSLSITGGTIVINGPTESMNGALDVDGTFEVSSATLLAAGSAGMAMAPDGEDQAVLSVQFQSTVPAGSVIEIADADGTTVAAFEPSKATQSLVLTSPDLVEGASYTVTLDGSLDGTTLGGLLVDGTVSGGSAIGTVTAD